MREPAAVGQQPDPRGATCHGHVLNALVSWTGTKAVLWG